MTLRCAICGSDDTVGVVCHHCGRPLCTNEKTCRVVIDDNAFAGSVKAYHCPECAKKYHPRSTDRWKKVMIRLLDLYRYWLNRLKGQRRG